MLLWCRIAESLNCTVQEALPRVTSRQFIRYKLYFEEKERRRRLEPTVEDLYAAQLAFEVYILRMVVVNKFLDKKDQLPYDQKFKDFILPFPDTSPEGIKAQKKKDKSARKFALEQATASAMLKWGTAFGVTIPPPEK